MTAAARPQPPGYFRQRIDVLIWLTPLLLLFAAGLASAAPPAQRAHPDWVGAKRCANCHAAEYAAWRESHHDLAMQAASATTVLGNFDNARFDYAGISSRFFAATALFGSIPTALPARCGITVLNMCSAITRCSNTC